MRCDETGGDCPDPEACQQSWPCEIVQKLHKELNESLELKEQQ